MNIVIVLPDKNITDEERLLTACAVASFANDAEFDPEAEHIAIKFDVAVNPELTFAVCLVGEDQDKISNEVCLISEVDTESSKNETFYFLAMALKKLIDVDVFKVEKNFYNYITEGIKSTTIHSVEFKDHTITTRLGAELVNLAKLGMDNRETITIH